VQGPCARSSACNPVKVFRKFGGPNRRSRGQMGERWRFSQRSAEQLQNRDKERPKSGPNLGSVLGKGECHSCLPCISRVMKRKNNWTG